MSNDLQRELSRAIRDVINDPDNEMSDTHGAWIEALGIIDPFLLVAPLEDLMQCYPFTELQTILYDVWDKEASDHALQALYTALHKGAVAGNLYVGDCCCMRGVFAKVNGFDSDTEDFCSWYEEKTGVEPNPWLSEEEFFFHIDRGDTPENSVFVRIAIYMMEQYAKEKGIVLFFKNVSNETLGEINDN